MEPRSIVWMLSCVVAPMSSDLRVDATDVRVGTDAHSAVPSDAEQRVRISLSWSNAWRDRRNHDEVWLFVKARAGTDSWRHVLLARDGHTSAPQTQSSPRAEILVSEDRAGAFVRCASDYRGDVGWTIELGLDELSLPASDQGTLELRPFGLEMVAIPAGAFFVGDPDPASAPYSTFFRSGESGTRAGVLEIASEGELEVAPRPGALWYEVDRDQAQYGGDRRGPIEREFPKGFDAFHLMKYEVSQGEYAAFLDTLSDSAASLRAIHGMPRYVERRGTIDLVDDHYVAASPRRPCNFISWDDGCAFADWAALRPMTELEYVKACRGPREPIAGEYPWGTNSRKRLKRLVRLDGDLETGAEADESRLDDSIRDVLGASYYGVLDLAGSVWERCVTIGHPRGRAFRGTHGDGRIHHGCATNEDWPRGDSVSGGYGYRGGGFYEHGGDFGAFNPWSPIEWRRFGSWGEAPRSLAYGFRCARSASSRATGTTALGTAALARAVDRSRTAIHRFLAASGAPGLAAAVARDGVIVWSEGFGFADLEQLVAVGSSTRFGIGSISKALTTAALAVLAERGSIDLDAPLETYLPEFPHQGRGVTARLVAAHISGLSDAWAASLYETTVHYETTREVVEHVWAEPLEHEPGTRAAYGTGTYALLAALIEAQTGRSYADAVQELVLEPLLLDDTTLNVRRSLVPRRTSFYVRDDAGQVVNAPFVDPSHKYAGAGYLASAEDVARFGSMLARPGFLTAETLEQLFTPVRLSDGTPGTYGLAWRITPLSDGSSRIDIPGGGLGISSYVRISRADGFALAILSNLTGADVGGELADEIEVAFRAP